MAKKHTGIGDVMDAVCNGLFETLEEGVIESSDNDNDSGEIYYEAPDGKGDVTKYLIRISTR